MRRGAGGAVSTSLWSQYTQPTRMEQVGGATESEAFLETVFFLFVDIFTGKSVDWRFYRWLGSIPWNSKTSSSVALRNNGNNSDGSLSLKVYLQNWFSCLICNLTFNLNICGQRAEGNNRKLRSRKRILFFSSFFFFNQNAP